jgi:transposase
MRGEREKQTELFIYRTPNSYVADEHPLRKVKELVDPILASLSPLFDKMYTKRGRRSIPPERLLKALLLQALYTVRSERQLCEQIEYNILFRWFLDMEMNEKAFDPTVFTKNRDRLLDREVGRRFFDAVVDVAYDSGWASEEHFTVDGTLIEAWASMKSFRPIDDSSQEDNPTDNENDKGQGNGNRQSGDDPGNPSVDFHGEKRTNSTHRSTTDPEARLAKKGKGKEAKLAFMGNALMENRNGLLVDFDLRQCSGTAERDGAIDMLDRAAERDFEPSSLGADKGYCALDFIDKLEVRGIQPHVAAREKSTVPRKEVTDSPGYAISQKKRKLIEEIFGWFKTIGGMRKTRFIGVKRVGLQALLAGAAYNLLRIANLESSCG